MTTPQEQTNTNTTTNTTNKTENNNNNKDNNSNKTENTNSKRTSLKPYDYSFITRFFLTLLSLINHILFLILILFFFNFHLDSPTYNFDYFGITRLSSNPHFTLCSIIDCRFSPIWLSTVNIIILFVLFIQEIIFTNKSIKSIFLKRCPSDFIYFPKLISRLISSTSFIMSMMLYQPTPYEWSFHFDISKYIRPIWFGIPFIVGLIQCMKSLFYLIGWNDELCSKMMYNAVLGKGVPRIADYIYGDGVYFKMRSPFRGGVMIMAFCINVKWNVGRVIYYIMLCFCFYVETVNEDRYYFEKFENYRKYMKEVKNRFYNIDTLLFKTKQKPILKDKKE